VGSAPVDNGRIGGFTRWVARTPWPVFTLGMLQGDIVGALLVRLSDSTNSRTASAEQFVLPCGSAIHLDSQESWRQLEAALPGAALATTTTLLAALWPDDHFVFDWRVEAAANALRIDAGLPATRWAESEMEGRKRTTSDFSDYATVRSWLREIDCPLNSLERALYRLSQKVPSVKGRSWPDYASAVANVLQRCDE
jgi:hypothetical protein